MKRSIYLISFFILINLGHYNAVNAQSSSPPNILLIITDDQGYHDVSYYGTEDIRTPHIDSLAASGMRFDRFYANCTECWKNRQYLRIILPPGYLPYRE